jgi:ECF transporter S component (folate family)
MKFLDTSGVQNFKNIRALTVTAMLIALTIVGDTLPVLRIIPGVIEIRFGFIFLATIAFLFGPALGFSAGVISNVISFLVFPGGVFNPLFDLNKGLEGIFYASFLYKKNAKSKYFIIRIAAARICVNVICNMIIRTALLIQSGALANSWVAISPRIVSNAARLPVDIMLLIIILTFTAKIAQRFNLTPKN